MSLEQAWNQIGEQQDDDLAALLQVKELPKVASQDPLQSLRKNLMWGMISTTVLTIGLLLIMVFHPSWLILITFGALLIIHIAALYSTWRIHEQLNADTLAINPVLTELKRQHQAIIRWLSYNKYYAFFLYLLFVFAGGLMGPVIAGGAPEEALRNPKILLFLVGYAIVMIPVASLLTKKMEKSLYYKHADALKKMIDEMESGC